MSIDFQRPKRKGQLSNVTSLTELRSQSCWAGVAPAVNQLPIQDATEAKRHFLGLPTKRMGVRADLSAKVFEGFRADLRTFIISRRLWL